MPTTLKAIMLAVATAAIFSSCSREQTHAAVTSYPVFPKIGKTYIIGIAKHTPRNEFTPISSFHSTILEHGGGSWYRISFVSYDFKPPKTVETWFNMNEAIFVTEENSTDSPKIFPIF